MTTNNDRTIGSRAATLAVVMTSCGSPMAGSPPWIGPSVVTPMAASPAATGSKSHDSRRPDVKGAFDPQRKLFSIGYNVSNGQLDGSYYDMLASEARLASFIAIATGTVPQEHWFKLARAMTGAGSERAP